MYFLRQSDHAEKNLNNNIYKEMSYERHAWDPLSLTRKMGGLNPNTF